MMPAQAHTHHAKRYRTLLVMGLLSFLSMYALTYAMVDAMPNVYANLNQVYMAGLRTAPMLIFELLLMRAMYPDGRWNAKALLSRSP